MSKQLDDLRKQRKQLKDEVEAAIRQWTGLSDGEHRMLIYESGLEFLQIMEGDTEGEYFKKMESKRSFWNWWTTKWYSRDVAFLRQELPHWKHLKTAYIEPKYKAWHQLEYLMKKDPLEDSYYHFLEMTRI